MARGTRRPPEWRGGVRLAGAPGELGRRGADGREPRTGWAVESWLRLSPRNFLGRLGWRNRRRRLSAGRRGEVPSAGSWGLQDAWRSVPCGTQGTGGLGTAAFQAYAVSLLPRGTRCLSVPRAAEEPPGSPGGRGRQGAAGAFARLQVASVTVPQFPRNWVRVYCSGPKGPECGFRSGAGRAPRPDAAGVREAVGAWSRRHTTGALRVCRI